MKRTLSVVLVLVMLFSLVGCGNTTTSEPTEKEVKATTGEPVEVSEPAANKGDTLVVWTFTDELKGIIENYYEKNNDLDYEIEVVVVPNENYQSKLDPALGSGKAAPDVFAVEAAYAKKYFSSKYTKDLRTMGIEPTEIPIMQYVKDVATTENGEFKGLSWQATPGAYFYRRSLAQKYLGVSEPEDVQPLLADFDKFYEAALTIKEKSNGETKIISSLGDLTKVFKADRKDGWIVDNKFTIDPKIEELMEIGKKFTEEGLTNDAEQWTETWFASMSNDEVFGYFLPTWGLHYVLKTNAENANSGETTAGDWAMVQGPAPYFWGGTWLTIREGTEMEQAAYDLINYLTLNEEFLTAYAKESGDFLANVNVVENVKDTYSDEFLAGQNQYAMFAEMAKGIDATTMTGSDLDIDDLFDEQLMAYTKGEKNKEDALESFTSSVKDAFPNLDY